MKSKNGLFYNKKILIYGLGKTGISSLNYLKSENYIKCFDDNFKLKKIKFLKKYIISKKELKNHIFDHIIISPGIDSLNCKLKNFLKKYKKKYIQT